MSIKIHHGPPGSYKTSGAIADDLLTAVVAGRHIITNVRGLSDENRIREVIEGQGKTVPDTFKLTYIKTDPTDTDFPEASCSENMEMLRRFWHWSPSNVFFILDEVQEIWPRSYKETYLKKLEYPGGIQAANADERFLTIELAFEKHRHKNWDFILTTPHINKVHPVIRGSSEAAYKHKNLALLGGFFKGRYMEGFHSADTNGKPSDFYSIQRKKIPSYVFNLYKSTATGVVRDTTAGQSIFANPRVLLLLGILLLVIVFVVSMGVPRIFSGGDKKPSEQNAKTNQAIATAPVQTALPNPKTGGESTANNASVRTDNVGVSTSRPLPPRLAIFASAKAIYLDAYFPASAKLKGGEFIAVRVVSPNGAEVVFHQDDLIRLGLRYRVYANCYAEVTYSDTAYYTTCEPYQEPQNQNIPDTVADAAQQQNPFATPPALAK